MTSYQITEHFSYRADQRNFSDDQIDFIVEYGRKEHRAGVIFCQMLDKCIPTDLPGNHPYRKLNGVTVVLCACGQLVITAYRNPRAFKRDRRKPKYRKDGNIGHCTRCHQCAMH